MGPWLVEIHDRGELDLWLGGRPPLTFTPVVMLVRGDSPAIRELLPNVLDAAKLNERRVVVWARDETMLTDDEHESLFLDDDQVVAAVLGRDRKTAAWLYAGHLNLEDAVFAFDSAARA